MQKEPVRPARHFEPATRHSRSPAEKTIDADGFGVFGDTKTHFHQGEFRDTDYGFITLTNESAKGELPGIAELRLLHNLYPVAHYVDGQWERVTEDPTELLMIEALKRNFMSAPKSKPEPSR